MNCRNGVYGLWNSSYDSTVDMLTMHNASPLLVLCIVTLYARQNVSQSMTIVTSAKKCHACKIIM